MAFLKEGLDAKEGVFVGNQVGDAPQAIAGAAKKLEAVYYSPYPEPRLHGADELHGQGDGRQVRGVGRHAERRWLAGRRGGGLRPAARASARSTSTTWAAASAGAACQDYVTQGGAASPSRSRACR